MYPPAENEAQGAETGGIQSGARRQAGPDPGVEGGAGSSLKSEQKRTLHIRCEARALDDGLMEAVVDCVKPIGSTFRFLSDEPAQRGGRGRAPDAVTLISAGLGFCFMTQIGRVAKIADRGLGDTSVADWSPDGGVLAVAFREGGIQLWDAETGERIREIGGAQKPTWSPDGKRLACARADRRLTGNESARQGISRLCRLCVACCRMPRENANCTIKQASGINVSSVGANCYAASRIET